MGSTSSTSIEEENQRERTIHNNNPNTVTPLTSTPSQAEIQPAVSTTLSSTPIMTIQEETSSEIPPPSSPSRTSSNSRPPASPTRTFQPMNLPETQGVPSTLSPAYRMERTDTLNTVQHNNTDLDVNVVVQTDSRVLRQRSKSQEMEHDLSPNASQEGKTNNNDCDEAQSNIALVRNNSNTTAAAGASASNSNANGNNLNATSTPPATSNPPSLTQPSAAAATASASLPAATTGPRTPSYNGHTSRKSIKTRSKTSMMTKEVATTTTLPSTSSFTGPCLNPPSEVNNRLDTQVEVRVYPCNNSNSDRKKKFTQFMVKPEGVIIQGTNKNRTVNNDLGAEYANHIGRKLQRYELSDTRACQLLVTTHNKGYWVVPAPEAFSRHSGTCRLLGDRKHAVANHTLQVGDFLRVGSVGVVVIETHNGVENRILSEEKIQKIMKDTTNNNSGAFMDIGETDGENSDDSMSQSENNTDGESPVCYMCFDDENTEDNPLITPCKCRGDTRYVHVGCLRKWHTAEADNQICFLSSVDATCSVCKSTFKSDFKLKDGRLVKLFKSSLEPPYVSLLVATKHEMAQRLFNTRFQLSFSTIMKPDGRNATRPLQLGRSSGSDMVLDYRTVSARHATIRFKNGEFIFTDAQSSNGSYLYLRRPVELTPSQQVQFRLGRSMISMKVVNKWNRRLLRAVRRSGTSSQSNSDTRNGDDHSVGSNEEDVRITDGRSGTFTSYLPRRSRESIIESMPAPGKLHQTSSQHLDLLYALAYPKKTVEKGMDSKRKDTNKKTSVEESKVEEGNEVNNMMANVSIANAHGK